jgi:hypothetical protein
MSEQQLQVLLAFAFGVVFLVAILVLVIAFPSPTKAQYEIFRIVIALAAGGVAAVMPGLLTLRMQLSLTAKQKLAIQAGGALAVFVIVYFYSPAQAIVPTADVGPGLVINAPCGSNFQNVSGNVTVRANCN